MAGYDNIKNYGFDKLTAEEQRKIASKGGKASVKKRREKKLLKDILDEIGCTTIPEEKTRIAIAKMLGMEDADNVTFDVGIALKTMQQAMKGNIRALEFIRDTRGQNPKYTHNDTEKDNDMVLEFIEGMKKDD